MKRIRFTRHAKNRMRWRSIDQAIVEEIIDNPDRIEIVETRVNAFKKIGDIFYKVCYGENEDEIIVITVLKVGKK